MLRRLSRVLGLPLALRVRRLVPPREVVVFPRTRPGLPHRLGQNSGVGSSVAKDRDLPWMPPVLINHVALTF